MDILKTLKKMIKKCSNTLVSLVMDEEEPPYDVSDHFTILPNQEVGVHDFPILENMQKDNTSVSMWQSSTMAMPIPW